jgi:hypothetical protein
MSQDQFFLKNALCLILMYFLNHPKDYKGSVGGIGLLDKHVWPQAQGNEIASKNEEPGRFAVASKHLESLDTVRPEVVSRAFRKFCSVQKCQFKK